MSNDPNKNEEGQTGVAVAQKTKLQPPKMYKVLMHNDDYTTMEFVVHILQKFFNKNNNEAHAIMLEVHTRGFGICGIFTHEVAESKVSKVTKYAKEHGHPLKCSMEPNEA
jgi:ATP-dependent Clp protease adaptor protein ClpS